MADVTVLQAAWVAAGAAVSGAGLTVLGSYLTGKVTTKTTKLQIEAAATQRDEDRKLQVAAAQREARTAAHEVALAALTELWGEVYAFAYERQWLSDTKRAHEITEVSRSKAHAAVARVAFVASEPVADACREAQAAVLAVEHEADSTFVDASQPRSFSEVRQLLEELASNVEAKLKSYRDAARREIGTYY